MLVISHRGNICGINVNTENNPRHISELLNANIPVEIDVWLTADGVYLGHDIPTYKVTLDYLKNTRLWCHAKNINALELMLAYDINCFWHQSDDFTITSKGVIWTYPGKPVCKNSIIVDTAKDWRDKRYSCLGVCVDYID